MTKIPELMARESVQFQYLESVTTHSVPAFACAAQRTERVGPGLRFVALLAGPIHFDQIIVRTCNLDLERTE